MQPNDPKQILDKVIGQIFGFQNPLSLEAALAKFSFDVRLPQQVYDTTTNQVTWAQSSSPAKFITMENARKRSAVDDWIVPRRPLNNLEDLFAAWTDINYMATERSIESANVFECDNIYNCDTIYRSQDCSDSKNIMWCDSVHKSEFVVASQRSQGLSFCLRAEDSKESSNSFSVVWSGKVTNSFFVQDCYDVMDCMFCSHISSKRFCIANMQFEEAEYMQIRDQVIRWILTN
jgi:hypothetical protein